LCAGIPSSLMSMIEIEPTTVTMAKTCTLSIHGKSSDPSRIAVAKTVRSYCKSQGVSTQPLGGYSL
jgi:hypothetical protein